MSRWLSLSVSVHLGVFAAAFALRVEPQSNASVDSPRVKLIEISPLPSAPKPPTPEKKMPKQPTLPIEPEGVIEAPVDEPSEDVEEQSRTESSSDEAEVSTQQPDACVVACQTEEGVTGTEIGPSEQERATQRCWQSVGAELQRRAHDGLPRSLTRRSLRGHVVLRFVLNTSGHAEQLVIESKSGSALLERAVEAILGEPFSRHCEGEGRWMVTFGPR